MINPQKIILIALVVITLNFGLIVYYFFTKQRSEQATTQYLSTKSQLKTELQKASLSQSASTKIPAAFRSAHAQLQTIECENLERQLQTECFDLKGKVETLQPMLDDPKKANEEGGARITQEIVTILTP